MNNPKVTIITAVYNGADTIEQTIRSVIMQTYSNIEYILVDGGSTDGTLEIVRRHRESIHHFISEKDHGVYDAFNKGIRAATGEIVYFLNSDDYLYEESVVEHIVTLFERNISLNAIYGKILRKESSSEMDQVYGREFTEQDFIKGHMPPHQALFVKKRMFEKHGMFDLQFQSSSDFDFISKLYLHEKDKLLYIDQIIAVFRMGGLSTLYKTRIIGMRETERLIEKHFNQKVDLSAMEISNNALYRQWLETLLLDNRGISAQLRTQGFGTVAIFGTMKTAHYLLKDFTKEGFNVAAFIDNNPNMQGKKLEGIEIVSSEWLLHNRENIDAVILSLESSNDIYIRDDLVRVYGHDLKIISWKQLV